MITWQEGNIDRLSMGYTKILTGWRKILKQAQSKKLQPGQYLSVSHTKLSILA